MTSMCTTVPRLMIETVIASASCACCTEFVTSSQVSNSASSATGFPASAPRTNRRALGTSSVRFANVRVPAEGRALNASASCVPATVNGEAGIRASSAA
jgi:hypothetical protein